jgi:hypothetical protein
MISNDAVSEIAAFGALAPDTDSTTVGWHPSAPASSNPQPRSAVGHEGRFAWARLNAGCGFRKETVAGMRR